MGKSRNYYFNRYWFGKLFFFFNVNRVKFRIINSHEKRMIFCNIFDVFRGIFFFSIKLYYTHLLLGHRFRGHKFTSQILLLRCVGVHCEFQSATYVNLNRIAILFNYIRKSVLYWNENKFLVKSRRLLCINLYKWLYNNNIIINSIVRIVLCTIPFLQ